MKSPCRPGLSLPPKSAFAGFRFPLEALVVVVRWYRRFNLSYRDVEKLLVERGVEVSSATAVEQRGQRSAQRPRGRDVQSAANDHHDLTGADIIAALSDAGIEAEWLQGSTEPRIGQSRC